MRRSCQPSSRWMRRLHASTEVATSSNKVPGSSVCPANVLHGHLIPVLLFNHDSAISINSCAVRGKLPEEQNLTHSSPILPTPQAAQPQPGHSPFSGKSVRKPVTLSLELARCHFSHQPQLQLFHIPMAAGTALERASHQNSVPLPTSWTFWRM